MLEVIQHHLDSASAVPIPSRCPKTGLSHCERKNCRYYQYSDDARDLGERCVEPSAVAAGGDRQQREQDFHVATDTLDWHRAEQLALAGLQDADLTAVERDAWRARLDVVTRKI